MNMKKYIFILLLAFAVSCSDDINVEADLQFATESISNPDNVKIDYYSPDPSCMQKMYWVYANAAQSELTVKCTNFSPIIMGGYAPNYEFGSDLGHYEGDTFISSKGNWSATLIDSETLKFSFKEITEVSSEADTADETMWITAKDKKKSLKTSFYVVRFLNTTQAIPK